MSETKSTSASTALRGSKLLFAALTLGLAANALSLYESGNIASQGSNSLEVAGCALCIVAGFLSFFFAFSSDAGVNGFAAIMCAVACGVMAAGSGVAANTEEACPIDSVYGDGCISITSDGQWISGVVASAFAGLNFLLFAASFFGSNSS